MSCGDISVIADSEGEAGHVPLRGGGCQKGWEVARGVKFMVLHFFT
jgi:hypothetical protein